MPQTEHKTNKISMKFLPQSIEKDGFNSFPGIYDTEYCTNKTKKRSPKIPKKIGKCFQLILICQKLLKPFSSSHKNTDSEVKKINSIHKEKSKSTPQINIDDRLKVHKSPIPIEKVDVSIQTNIQRTPDSLRKPLKIDLDHRIDNSYFFKDNEMQTEDYWDLDIDSAIVGDFNSVSEVSLDEQIDPHYSTIKMLNNGKSIGKLDCITDPSIFSTCATDRSYSNTSSPKSGVYSKINKCKIKDEPLKFKLPIYNYLVSKSNPKLNFDQIMIIKNQLGLSREIYAFDDDSKLNFPSNEYAFCPAFMNSSDTPDLPKRNYGSSVINFITKLREERDSQRDYLTTMPSSKNSVVVNSDDISRITNVYSPIWYMKNKINENVVPLENTPASEPTLPRRSSKTIFDNLNPVFKDDSSEEASSISFYSPLKNKYSYPRNFSETYSSKPCLDSHYEYIDKRLMPSETDLFRHMDSEVDVSVSYTNSDNIKIKNCVPLELKHSDVGFGVEDKLFLQPLMERSCEEDFFMRDIASSLEYINV